MLPPDFRWHAVGTATTDRPNALLFDGVEVARLYQRIDDRTWWISLNNQRERDRRKATICSGYERGKAGAEIWADRHKDRIGQEVLQYRRLRSASKPPML